MNIPLTNLLHDRLMEMWSIGWMFKMRLNGTMVLLILIRNIRRKPLTLGWLIMQWILIIIRIRIGLICCWRIRLLINNITLTFQAVQINCSPNSRSIIRRQMGIMRINRMSVMRVASTTIIKSILGFGLILMLIFLRRKVYLLRLSILFIGLIWLLHIIILVGKTGAMQMWNPGPIHWLCSMKGERMERIIISLGERPN